MSQLTDFEFVRSRANLLIDGKLIGDSESLNRSTAVERARPSIQDRSKIARRGARQTFNLLTNLLIASQFTKA